MPPVTTPDAEVRPASIENRNQGRDDRVNEPHVQGDADGADDEPAITTRPSLSTRPRPRRQTARPSGICPTIGAATISPRASVNRTNPTTRMASAEWNTVPAGATNAPAGATSAAARHGAAHVVAGDRAPQKGARQPWSRPARGDLGGHESQQQTAHERDRRRHRQAVRQAQQDDEQREGPAPQDQQNVADGQPLARLHRERGQHLGCTRFWRRREPSGAAGREAGAPRLAQMALRTKIVLRPARLMRSSGASGRRRRLGTRPA